MGCPIKEDTITAICTPIGTSAIGIIRISGPDSIKVVNTIFLPKKKEDVSKIKRGLITGKIIDEDGKVIDDVIVLLMKSPNSYTGEDVVEIHAHGNMFILRTIIDLLLKRGVRIAEPGEFTKRAFLNGKLDLAQAEAVLDQILAKTKRSLELSRCVLEGHLSERIHQYTHQIKTVLAWVEAVIDFSEEEIPAELWQQSLSLLEKIAFEMKRISETAEKGKMIREGVSIAIAGKPNVGKSSLFNALLRESRAIVSPYPGTTRDHLEEYISLGGIPVRLIDTAGLREIEEPIEKEGVQRAWKAIDTSYIILFVLDSTNIDEEDKNLLQEIRERANKTIVIVVNKIDLNPEPKLQNEYSKIKEVVYTSATNGMGIVELEEILVKAILGEQEISEDIILSHEHQKNSIERAIKCINNCIQSKDLTPELVAFELREALQSLGEITGETATEELLDIIFSSFCIGK